MNRCVSLQSARGAVHEKPGHYLCLLLWKFQLGSVSENFSLKYAYFGSILKLIYTHFIRVGLGAEVLFLLQNSTSLMKSFFVCTCVSSHILLVMESLKRTMVYSKERGKTMTPESLRFFPMCQSQRDITLLYPHIISF